MGNGEIGELQVDLSGRNVVITVIAVHREIAGPIGWRRKLRPIPAVGLNNCCISAARCEEFRSFQMSHAEESVSEAPKPSIDWYCVASFTVMTGELWLPPVPNEIVGSGLSSMAWSPVVTTTCAFGPVGVKGACWLPPPQAARLRAREQTNRAPVIRRRN